jgi:dihydropteroate synthase
MQYRGRAALQRRVKAPGSAWASAPVVAVASATILSAACSSDLRLPLSFRIHPMRSVFQWNLGKRTLELGKRTLIMGIVNVTPDSFSDGGLYLDSGPALAHALQLLDEGADIIDVGGESTRPGAKAAVTAEEELRRVLPVITALKQQRPDALISIDTYKASVARAAAAAGAEIVNDVSALRWDPQMARTISEIKCGAVLMHMRGRPEEWRTLPPPGDIVLLVKRELREWAEAAVLAGVRRERIALDPGFGFGKNFEQNYPLLARFQELQSLGFPLLAGTSRKSFLGRALAKDGKDAPAADRLYGNLAAHTALILKGAHILRTHDVKAAVEAARVADAILEAR